MSEALYAKGEFSGLPVKCPQCKRVMFHTTDKFDPDLPPNGSMVRFLKNWHLDWLCVAGTKASEMTCPECLGQLAHGGRLLVDIPKPDSGLGLDAAIVDGAEKHTCPVCGKECKNELGLNSHMRSHAKDE